MYSTLIIDPKKFKDIESSIAFAKLIQMEENVLVFPGEVDFRILISKKLFNHENFVRLVMCVDIDQIEEACVRIRRFCLNH